MTPAAFIDDPNWARGIPEIRDAARVRHLPTHEDCAALDSVRAASHLRRGGTLGAFPGYEERPGQIDMLRAIAEAFNRREHLMIEAGTGTGKSLAYLIPAILWAWTNDTPVVVSTATRNLQSQLVQSDIPKALAVLGEDAAKFRFALLKGRTNYLCLRAVGEFFAAGYWTMSESEKAAMPAFIDWLTHTPDGDLDGFEGLPRTILSTPGEECAGRRCPHFNKCFVRKARRAAADAHLVVVNHALVLAEAASPGCGILPAYGRLILDEAHNLEEIATDFFSREFSLPALARILNRLLRKARGRRFRAGGIVTAVQHQIQKGALASGDVRRHLDGVSVAVARVTTAADALADAAEALRAPAGPHAPCRYCKRDGVRMHSLHRMFEPYGADIWNESALMAAQDRFDQAMAALVNLLHALADDLDAAVPEGCPNPAGDLVAQLQSVADSLVAFSNDANFVLSAEDDAYAFWAERVRVEKRPSHLRLVGAPLSVAADLKRVFYDVKDSVVLSSATLRVGNDFRYMTRRLGCTERFRALTVPSPFDYLRQALVLAPDCLPDPAADAEAYAQALGGFFADLFSVTRGRALVLFTSYEMMKTVASFSQGLLAEKGIRLLVQGEGLSRESMTRHLKESVSASAQPSPTVLFGAQSFWEGVDVAGAALSCVVMARLPFAQFGEPIVEARSEKIEREGGSAFRDYALPEAVIRFRQGFGRLVRTKSDRGVVIVTDPRLVTKNYGTIFRRSIPASVHAVSDVTELLDRVKAFF